MTPESGSRGASADSGNAGRQPDDGTEEVEDIGHDASGAEGLGWRGWVLVGGILVAFIAVPWTVVLLPRAQGLLATLGLGLRDAYLVLPLLPAIALASLAVWAAVASQRTR